MCVYVYVYVCLCLDVDVEVDMNVEVDVDVEGDVGLYVTIAKQRIVCWFFVPFYIPFLSGFEFVRWCGAVLLDLRAKGHPACRGRLRHTCYVSARPSGEIS